MELAPGPMGSTSTSVSSSVIKSQCSGVTPGPAPNSLGGPPFLGSASLHPLPLGGLGGCEWDGPGPGWNVWSWWVGEWGTCPPPCPHWGA